MLLSVKVRTTYIEISKGLKANLPFIYIIKTVDERALDQ